MNGTWRFDPAQKDGWYYAIMQADGNLVIYRGTDPSASRGPCWATNTYRYRVGPAYQAVLTGDGNLEVRRTSGAVTSVIWQSKLDYPGRRAHRCGAAAVRRNAAALALTRSPCPPTARDAGTDRGVSRGGDE